MKASYKASLLSAFVFPGVGHLYLRKYWRGLMIMFVFLSGSVFLMWSSAAPAFSRLDSIAAKMQSGSASLREIAEIAGTQTAARAPYYDFVFYLIICVWLFAVIDAFRIGRNRDFQKNDTFNSIHLGRSK
jgi:hypothetical protein